MLKVSAFVGAILILCGGLGCGGDSGTARPGTGGTTAGSGGATVGTGGASAGTGGVGVGGAGGTAGFPCAMAQAPNVNITSFSDATSTGRWGTAPTSFTGGTFSYGPGGMLMSAVDVVAHNFRISGTVMGYGGGGLYFDVCTDASRFTGVQFVVSGDLGGCALELQLQTNSTKPVENSSMKGACTAPCASPAAKMLVAPGTVAVTWGAVMGGTPTPFSSNGNKELVGIQWQLTSAATCSPNITIDDVVWTM